MLPRAVALIKRPEVLLGVAQLALPIREPLFDELSALASLRLTVLGIECVQVLHELVGYRCC